MVQPDILNHYYYLVVTHKHHKNKTKSVINLNYPFTACPDIHHSLQSKEAPFPLKMGDGHFRSNSPSWN